MDAIKGIAITLVVLGHVWRGINLRGLVPESLFEAIDLRIYAFHMPVFFAASGFFLVRQVARRSFGAFLGDRIRRLIWPMLLWTYLFLGMKLLAGPLANDPVRLADLLILPIPGHLHLWFLWALFVQHILAYWALRSGGKGAPDAWFLTGLLMIALALAVMPWPKEILYWFNAAFQFAPFLVIGIIMGQYLMHNRLPAVVTLGSALIFLLFLAFAPEFIFTSVVASMSCQIILTMTFILLIKGAVEAGAPSRVVVQLGQASLAIYLAHTIFAAAGREWLLVLGIDSLMAHVLFGLLTGIAGPLALLWTARQMRIAGFMGI